jgi:hypothetical protein
MDTPTCRGETTGRLISLVCSDSDPAASPETVAPVGWIVQIRRDSAKQNGPG